jgi:hypothetical protein
MRKKVDSMIAPSPPRAVRSLEERPTGILPAEALQPTEDTPHARRGLFQYPPGSAEEEKTPMHRGPFLYPSRAEMEKANNSLKYRLDASYVDMQRKRELLSGRNADLTPGEYLLQCVRNPMFSPKFRAQCASQLLAYVHPRVTELPDHSPAEPRNYKGLALLSDEELLLLEKLRRKVEGTPDQPKEEATPNAATARKLNGHTVQ